MNEERWTRCGHARAEFELTCPHCSSSSESEMSIREVQRLQRMGGRGIRFAHLLVVWTINGFLVFCAVALLTKLGIDQEGLYLHPYGLFILILPLVLTTLTGIGVALFIRARPNRQLSFVGQIQKSGGGGIRFAYLFCSWTILGIVLFGTLSLLGCLALELLSGNAYAKLGLALLLSVIPIILATIGVILSLYSRNKRRPSPMRIKNWKAVEFDEAPNKTPENVAQSGAFSKR